jgi:DNA adenine methylase
MTSTSPLRYPGGKTRFTKFIWEAVQESGEDAHLFVEPFCGGSGAALALLESGKVERIALNDCDPLISSFWKVVFGKSRKSRHDINWLIGTVESAEISVDEWRRVKASKPDSLRTAAWKCLFLNRTSFNGIIHKAGPIGGWEQKNRSLDVRFNREKLIKRLGELYDLRDQIERVDCLGWRQFCSYFLRSQGVYFYLDPPYYHKAEQLYGYLFSEKDHISMRDYLINIRTPWMLSYDDAPEVRGLYNNRADIHGRVIDQTYSAHPVGGASFVGRELFFSNRNLPTQKQKTVSKPHVGLTIVGCFREVELNTIEPIRIPTIQPAAVGS